MVTELFLPELADLYCRLGNELGVNCNAGTESWESVLDLRACFAVSVLISSGHIVVGCDRDIAIYAPFCQTLTGVLYSTEAARVQCYQNTAP
jgi:hypothetical protein